MIDLPRWAAAFIAAGLAACAQPNSTPRHQCVISMSSLPDGWVVDGARISMPVESLSLLGSYSNRVVALTVVSCEMPSGSTLSSHCDQVAEIRARMETTQREAIVRSGMRVENFPYFTSTSRPYFGLCHAGPLATLSTQTDGGCRIWVANQHTQRSLVLVAPAVAFDDFPAIVDRVSFLLEQGNSRCE